MKTKVNKEQATADSFVCERANEWGACPVIHPHAGSYIEFSDEIEAITSDIPYEVAGL